MELPLLQPIYQKYKDRGFEIVAVDVRADNANAQKFIADNKLTYNFLIGGRQQVGDWKIRVAPSSFMIDRNGIVTAFKEGFDKGDEVDLDATVAKLVQ